MILSGKMEDFDMKRYYFIVNDNGTLEETKIDMAGLSGHECELALFGNSDIIIRAKNKAEAIDIIDTEYLENRSR